MNKRLLIALLVLGLVIPGGGYIRFGQGTGQRWHNRVRGLDAGKPVFRDDEGRRRGEGG